ncbi:MAG: T9SS type A sorting domain-containing protein [Bacteroidetes bacterium]|nr:T9SS type A sorting domain-containing protein [Bacteroidota bacterium]
MDPYKMKVIKHVIYFILLSCAVTNAQFTNWNWAFGDSCGIKFNSTGIDSSYITSVNARGTCASISDASNNLLFYASSPDYNIWNSFNYERGAVYNNNHQVMQNGLYIKTSAWYHEMVILPDPGNANEFYIFTAGVTSTINPGLRYSKVDLSQNGGLGAVTQKNILLYPNPINDGLLAIKHGNGRDWWLIYKHSDFQSDTIQTLLVTPNGITITAGQPLGAFIESGFYRFAMNPGGTVLAGISIRSVIELFDFDRCTGLLSNHRYIRNNIGSTDLKERFWSVEFSSSGRYLYVATADWTSYLFQFDLQNAQPWQSKVLLDSIDVPLAPASTIRRAPDNRIYRSIAWNNGTSFNYPYPDTAWNIYNTHLSVINYPDSGGLVCDYQPFSVFLPGCRTYLGLPNNPDYTLGPVIGSPCDTLSVGIIENEATEQLVVAPNPFKDQFKVTPIHGVFSANTKYEIYDMLFQKGGEGRIDGENNAMIRAENLLPGVYLLKLFSGTKPFRVKIVKADN